ncbi:carboxylesterase [Penicillium waksmanii]|uniref:carboxylesterase n=1 Tax=Penicillium waksmanii TaxID=69791 RepID=UPI002547F5D0|nr:carboxylesterase [Penicillium waksmanii]KAJ5984373.1 carboxylesterase [Penicillium waksmanii]
MAMTSIFTSIRYLYLKVLITFSRLLINLLSSSPKPNPDYILQIPSRQSNRTIKVHVYNPLAENIGEAPSPGPAPVLINLYGSGLTIPLHGLDDPFCRFVSKNTNYIVLDVEYSLAPEFPFPNALNDVEDVLNYVESHPDQYDSEKISISGFSSGGTLALAIAASASASASTSTTHIRRAPFKSLIAFYPATNLSQDPALRKTPVGGKERSPFWTRIFRKAYIGPYDSRDPRISPAFVTDEDMARLPQYMLFVTGGVGCFCG